MFDSLLGGLCFPASGVRIEDDLGGFVIHRTIIAAICSGDKWFTGDSAVPRLSSAPVDDSFAGGEWLVRRR